MDNKDTSIFPSILLSFKKEALIEQVQDGLFARSIILPLHEIRSKMENTALLLPENVTTSAGWKASYAPVKLSHFNLKVPKTASHFTIILKNIRQIVQTHLELHRMDLSLGLLTQNRLWQNEQNQLKILGFHLVRPWSDIPAMLKLSNQELAYIPPEYSEQTTQIPDHRADFYSLGILLYQWLTGQLPYQGKDSLETIHQHLSSTPMPPTQLNNTIPKVLEAITLVLLEKDPDNRYQSAEGLLEDINDLLEIGWDQPKKSLRQSYSPGILRIKGRLYGRSKEMRLLKTAFQHTKSGNENFVLVGGNSGVGKTALVQAFQNEINSEHHFFLEGKFDQYQNTPYSTWITAFEQLVHQLLFLPDAELSTWKKQIQQVVGNNGGVLLEVIPNLRLLIGQQPLPEKLSPIETQNRFIYLFLKFCKVFARTEHPLVVFIDDWQWTDIPSIQLLKKLLEEDLENLMVLAAYRDNEIHDGHPFSMMVKELENTPVSVNRIALRNLEKKHVNQLLSEALGEEKTHTSKLAKIIFEKTNGNAFFTRQLIQSFWEKKLLTFNWTLAN